MADLKAAMRDHSFDERARRGKTWLFHALVERDGRLVMACGDGFHIAETEEPAAGLLASERCNRSGCKQAFARHDEEIARGA